MNVIDGDESFRKMYETSKQFFSGTYDGPKIWVDNMDEKTMELDDDDETLLTEYTREHGISAKIIMHALEEQKSILDDRDCYFIPPYRILKSTIFHAEELRKFINTKFIDQNAFDRFLFWIVRIPVEDRIEVFEEAWSDLNPYNENCWQPFREVVISADRCFNVLNFVQ